MTQNTPSPSGERTFLASNGIVVTNARFAVGGQTYAVANITSVKSAPKNIGTGVILIIFALLLMLASWKAALVVAAVGAASIWLAPATVVLATAGGEVKALQSGDGKFIQAVVAALNEAIISRG